MRFRKPIVGVDIGSRTMKGLRLVKSRRRVMVDGFFFYDVADGNEAYPLDVHAGEALSALAHVNDFGDTIASTSLPDSQLIVHETLLPAMPPADMRLAIRNEIESTLNLNPDDTQFDMTVIDENLFEHGQRLVRVYACPKSPVTDLVDLVQAAGMKVKYVEAGLLAVVSMLGFNEYIDSSSHYAVVEIGESHTTIALVSSGKVVFHNVILTGLGAINQALFEQQGLPYSESEAIKLAYDLGVESAEAGDASVIDQTCHELFYKIVRSVEVARIRLKGDPIKSILITGGGSQLKNIERAMESYASIKTEVVDPFRNLLIEDRVNATAAQIQRAGPYMGTAVGLALRAVE